MNRVIATHGELSRRNKNQRHTVDELVIGDDGSVWISTMRGLARYGTVFESARE